MKNVSVLLGVVLLAGVSGCGMLKKRPAGEDAGPSAAAASAATNAPASSGVAPAKAKSLDATNCNPGTSLEPIDKGKTIQSDHFKYTLLDVRTDVVDNAFAPIKKVYLVKLEVENITNKPQLNLSVADVDFTRDKAGADRVKEKALHFKNDFFYARPKMCVDLGADVKPGMLPPGAKVVGYYAYSAPDTPVPKSLWFDARNVSPEAAGKGGFLKVAGTLRVK